MEKLLELTMLISNTLFTSVGGIYVIGTIMLNIIFNDNPKRKIKLYTGFITMLVLFIYALVYICTLYENL